MPPEPTNDMLELMNKPSSYWLKILHEQSGISDKRATREAAIRTKLAFVDRPYFEENTCCYRPVVLHKTRKHTWELHDETGDSTIDTVQESDVLAQIGVMYNHPTKGNFDKAVQTAKNNAKKISEVLSCDFCIYFAENSTQPILLTTFNRLTTI